MSTIFWPKFLPLTFDLLREYAGGQTAAAAILDNLKENVMAEVHVAPWVRLDAKPGKEKEVADFLHDGLAIVQEEPATTA
ncbi:MAG TPA: hypothetical protein VK513_11065 [Terriglobales bacterium]|nr:hypothetical protein [Terriglobales bacterium]